MGKFESSKSAQGRDQVADQVGYSSIPIGLLRSSNDTGPRSTGISVTAGAIGMGLAAQSASQDGLMAFAATLPGADVLVSLAKGDTQSPAQSADVAGGEGLGGASHSHGAAIGAEVDVDPLQKTAFESADAEFSVAPGIEEGQFTSQIGVDASTIGSVSGQGVASLPANLSADAQLNVGAGAGTNTPAITIVPGDRVLPDADDITGDEGPAGAIIGSVIGDDGLVGGVLDGVVGDGGLLDAVVGEDGLVSGLLGDGGVIDSVLGDGGLVDGLVDGVLGDDGLVGGLVGDGGVVDALLGDDGLVGGVLGDNGVVDMVLSDDGLVGGLVGDGGVVDGLLGDDGLVGGVLGDNGVVDMVLGDDGLVGGLVGDDGVVDDLLGDDGLLGGLLGGGGSEPAEIVSTDLVDAAIPEVSGVLEAGAETVVQVTDGVLGDGGLVDSITGDDGLVGGVLGDDGVVDMVLGDDALADGLLAEGGVVDELVGDDGLVGDVLGDSGVVDVVLGNDGLLGSVLGGGSPEVEDVVPTELPDAALVEVSEVLDAGTETVTQVVGDALGEAGPIGGIVGNDGVVDDLLANDGLVGGLLGGETAEAEEDVPAAVETTLTEVSDAVETVGETVAQVADDVLGDGGLVDGVVGDGGLLGGLLGSGAEVEEVVPTDLADAAITEVSDALEDGAATAEPVINAAADAGSVMDDVAVVGGILGGLLGGQAASSEASPLTEEPVADASGETTSEPDDAQASLGQDEIDPVTSIETPQSSPAADVSDAALLDDVSPSEDAGDDGFLDTLVAGATEDLLGSAETLLDPSDPLLDGLLGEDDVFGLNVVEGDEGDDLFAGLAGEQGLTGSLVEQDVLGLSNSGEEDAPDAEVDNLLNDILAGGVSDITGEDGAFDALLNNDAAAEEEGELLAADDAAVAEAGAVEGALDILFDQGADSGHSLLGGLLQETSDIDNA